MRIWFSCFLLLFAIAELFQWMEHWSLPLPIYILGGAFLAIASNYSKLNLWFAQDLGSELPSVIDSTQPSTWEIEQSQSNPVPQPPRSISFTISRTSEQRRSIEPE